MPPKRKPRRRVRKVAADVLKTTASKKLPLNTVVVPLKQLVWKKYRYTYTTGPFALPLNTHSIDWGILNNTSTTQKVRVTVFKCWIGSVKTAEPPDPLEITIPPGRTTHNANAATGAFFYEIQVECSSRRIFPYASAWDKAIANPIPGTVVKSAEFIRQLS